MWFSHCYLRFGIRNVTETVLYDHQNTPNRNLVPMVYFVFNHVYNSKPWDGNSYTWILIGQLFYIT